ALGATPMSVFWLMLQQGRTLAIVGTAIGLVLAYLSGRVIANNVYQARAADPLVLGGATLIVVAIALIATTIPAFRASRLEPSRLLRPEEHRERPAAARGRRQTGGEPAAVEARTATKRDERIGRRARPWRG